MQQLCLYAATAFMYGVYAHHLSWFGNMLIGFCARRGLEKSENSSRGWIIPCDVYITDATGQCLDYLFEIGVKMKLAGLLTVL